MTALEKLRWISSQVRLSDPSGLCANLLDQWIATHVVELSARAVDRGEDTFASDRALRKITEAVLARTSFQIENLIPHSLGGGIECRRTVTMIIEEGA